MNDINTPSGDFAPDNDIKDLRDTSGFPPDSNDSIIKVVGVGGGGCNAVSYMYKLQIPHINFVVCNTDRQALEMSPVPNKILLGPGLGAGNKPEIGRKYAEEYRDKIAALFQDKTEMVFITAGMGGGTGTGAGPIVAQVAKEAGMLTIGIVTVPFLFEGEKKILKALDGAKEMKKHVDALLVINNENLVELYKDLNFFNAFGKADDTLADAARSISEIISEPCYINVDFQDVKTTLRDSGTAIISTAIGEGEHRITNAIQNALHSPLLKKHDIYTSKRLLFKFMCWKDAPNALRAEEIAEITAFTNKLPSSIDVKWGIGDDPSLGEKVKITVLASGFDVTLRESDSADEQNSSSGADGSAGAAPKKIVMQGAEEQQHVAEEKKEEDKKAMEEFYGGEKIRKNRRDIDKMRYAVLTPSQFDDFEVIAMFERTPAHNRPVGFNEKLRQISEHTVTPEAKPSRPETPSGGDTVIKF